MLVIQLKIHLLACKFAFHKADLTFKISKLTDIMGHVLPCVLGNKFYTVFSIQRRIGSTVADWGPEQLSEC